MDIDVCGWWLGLGFERGFERGGLGGGFVVGGLVGGFLGGGRGEGDWGRGGVGRGVWKVGWERVGSWWDERGGTGQLRERGRCGVLLWEAIEGGLWVRFVYVLSSHVKDCLVGAVVVVS